MNILKTIREHAADKGVSRSLLCFFSMITIAAAVHAGGCYAAEMDAAAQTTAAVANGQTAAAVTDGQTAVPSVDVTIKLKANGGKSGKSSITVKSDGLIGKLPAASKDGYSFTGWFTKKNGGEQVTRRTPVSSLTAHTLYAVYEPAAYRIRFNKNGVLTKAPGALFCSYDKSYVLPGKNDPALDHWNTRKDDSGVSYKPGKKVMNLTAAAGKTVTLYAIAFSGKNNIEKLTRYLVRQGFTKQAAAGVAGNLMFESGGGPDDIKLNAVEYSTGRGIGMVQWTDTTDAPRRTNFERFCASHGKPWPNNDLKVQIDFLMAELSGRYGRVWVFSPSMGYPASYRMSLTRFKKCRNVAVATRAFCANFERPYARDAHLNTRIYYARLAYKYVS